MRICCALTKQTLECPTCLFSAFMNSSAAEKCVSGTLTSSHLRSICFSLLCLRSCSTTREDGSRSSTANWKGVLLCLGALSTNGVIVNDKVCYTHTQGLHWDWAPVTHRGNLLVNTSFIDFAPFPVSLFHLCFLGSPPKNQPSFTYVFQTKTIW